MIPFVFSSYSLDPDSDPLGTLLMIDYYALKSEQYSFLIRLFNEWEVSVLYLFDRPDHSADQSDDNHHKFCYIGCSVLSRKGGDM